MEERYARNIPALTAAEQETLGKKTVCVVGCGGLGGYVLEFLARIGVGTLIAVDGDRFEPSNLNRQLLATEALLGSGKAEAAAARGRAVNSAVLVRAVPEFFTAENGRALLEGCDLAVDALDSGAARRTLGALCGELGVPLIHGAIQGWTAQVTVCLPGSGRMAALYPRDAAPQSRTSLSFTPPFCASLEAAEAVKLLVGREPALGSRLLLADLGTMEFETLALTD